MYIQENSPHVKDDDDDIELLKVSGSGELNKFKELLNDGNINYEAKNSILVCC